ncbi:MULTISPECIES: TetR/AcrR family transcriptional regulator C-terminal domain-containing protein [unclassified Nocardia]|uniref:TetR/AcrR family transcriptional regulator C-terminal domain-containing protein n=1 Tax=unclassified Nocardia TaxID=2637762 RepID=UPI001CE4658F|nr:MULTISPECIES: TetR/AcrR family transcriptional regulator C-terminal domain-containing protein [unclassified Nocardia]
MSRPKRERLTAARAVAVAMELLDADGIEGVTLRRLAAGLGVQVPALYRHFAGKQDLLDELAQTIVSDGLAGLRGPDDPADWQDWLRETANRFHRALLSRRDGARIVAGAGPGRAQVLAQLTELTLRTLTDGGLGLESARWAAHTVFTFTLGYTIEEQAGPDSAAAQDPGILVPRFPLIADALQRNSGADGYAEGLGFILAGIQLRAGRETRTVE